MPSVKSRREQYSDATREALLETATEMFGSRGFGGTSLDDIATATRVTRGAVYHHFASKQAVFEEVLESLEMRMVQRVTEAAAREPHPWDAAMAGLEAFLDHCCDPIYGRLCWQEGPVALGGGAGRSARRSTPSASPNNSCGRPWTQASSTAVRWAPRPGSSSG
jgi:Transcriptional regulator